MTTIAYKDGIVAVDSRMTASGTILNDDYNKITELRNGGFMISAGTVMDIQLLEDILNDGWQHHYSEFYQVNEATTDFETLYVDHDGNLSTIIAYKGMLRTLRVRNDEIMTFGSGQEYALSAMIGFNKSAVDSVRHAMKFDAFTGGKIRTLCLATMEIREVENGS